MKYLVDRWEWIFFALQDSVELAEVDDQSDGIVFLGDSKTWGGPFTLLDLACCKLLQSSHSALVVDFVFEHVVVFSGTRYGLDQTGVAPSTTSIARGCPFQFPCL